MHGMKNTPVVTLDMGPELHRGRESFSAIMRIAAALEPRQKRLLIAPLSPDADPPA